MAYYLAAQRHLAGMDEETDWVIREWGETLHHLAGDRSRLIGRLDWVTKLWLLETFVREERLAWDDPWLASLDLEYHNIDPERGLYLGLEAAGKTTRVIGEADIEAAAQTGPRDTRGGIRGAVRGPVPKPYPVCAMGAGSIRGRLDGGDARHGEPF